MTPERTPITWQLLGTGIVTIFGSGRSDRLDAAAEVLVAAGTTCLELTLSTPGAVEMLVRLHDTWGRAEPAGRRRPRQALRDLTARSPGADLAVRNAVSAPPSRPPERCRAPSSRRRRSAR